MALATTNVDAVIANLRRIGALDLATRIATKYRVTPHRMLGNDRHKTPTDARHELWTILRHTLDFSLLELATLFDRDHSTIFAGVRKCERRLDAQYRKESA